MHRRRRYERRLLLVPLCCLAAAVAGVVVAPLGRGLLAAARRRWGGGSREVGKGQSGVEEFSQLRVCGLCGGVRRGNWVSMDRELPKSEEEEEEEQAERRASATGAGGGLPSLAGRGGRGGGREAVGHDQEDSIGAGREEGQTRASGVGRHEVGVQRENSDKLVRVENGQLGDVSGQPPCGFWTKCCCIRKQMEENARGSGPGDDLSEADLQGIINKDAEHLVILVNGIVGSRRDWRFAADRMTTRLGRQVAIHCSQASEAKQTFDGVDVMGLRLAAEVRNVISGMPSAKRISFLAHSLGGLISRSAISHLYSPALPDGRLTNGVVDSNGVGEVSTKHMQGATIGGLQPENFITLATPHLGCRGNQQLPFLFGISPLEKISSWLAHWFIGKSGRHLFLTDGGDKELPLLRKMATDCKEGQFISSLGAFRRRTAYANVANDQLVGWRTSSIRRKSEMPKLPRDPLDPKYPHIFREEEPPSPSHKDVSAVDHRPSQAAVESEDLLEYEMVTGLTRVPWHRVDVRFSGQIGSLQAHNLMQVKNPEIHRAGADVIEHVIDRHFMGSNSS